MPITTDRHARGGVAKLVANASTLSTPQALLSHLKVTAAKTQPKARRCCKPAASTRRQRAATRKGRSPTARRPFVQARR